MSQTHNAHRHIGCGKGDAEMLGIRPPAFEPRARLGDAAGAMPEPISRRLQWLLMALDAHERGQSASAAMREEDASGNGAAGVRRAFLALLAQAGAERSLVAHQRRHVLAQAASPLRVFTRVLGSHRRRMRQLGSACCTSPTRLDADRARSASRFGGAWNRRP